MEMPAIWPLESGAVAAAAVGASCVCVGVGVGVVTAAVPVGVSVYRGLPLAREVDVAVESVVSVEEDEVEELVVDDLVAVGIGSGVAEEVMGAKVKTPLSGPNFNVAVMTPLLGFATLGLSSQIVYALLNAISIFIH